MFNNVLIGKRHNRGYIALVLGIVLLLAGCLPVGAAPQDSGLIGQKQGPPGSSNTTPTPGDQEIPYYFIAIHCEPYYTDRDAAAELEDSFTVLTEEVAAADEYNIKLTMMFSPQYCDYIAADPSRLALVSGWQANGHEIAYHHHCEWHGGWDGYSNAGATDAQHTRVLEGHTPPEPYLGTLTDMMNHIYAVNPGVRSGCSSGESHKEALPDEVLIDTSSGFANWGPVGTRMGDADALKSRNDYMLVGDVNDIERHFLAHGHIIKPSQRDAVQKVFITMDSGVSGAVTHAVRRQDTQFYLYLDFLHSQDPTGSKSVTVTEVVDNNLIPEQPIDSSVLCAVY